jgi:hypothetical protein
MVCVMAVEGPVVRALDRCFCFVLSTVQSRCGFVMEDEDGVEGHVIVMAWIPMY